MRFEPFSRVRFTFPEERGMTLDGEGDDPTGLVIGVAELGREPIAE